MKKYILPVIPLFVLLINGCSTIGPQGEIEGHVPLNKSVAQIPESQLLDVWIEVFDPGKLPRHREDASGLSMDIREAEARYLPEHLRRTMEKTGYWGAVRMVPRDTAGSEVLVRGTILGSDGEQLDLKIVALDATGRRWFTKTYEAVTSVNAYLIAERTRSEAFQSLYNTIANDLAKYRATLNPEEILAIRRVAELRFAADLAPDPFSAYLQQDDRNDPGYTIVHLPAESDPMYRRVRAIRERDFMLIDTLNGHFDNFFREMDKPYTDWRKTRSEEAAALREIEQEAMKRKLLGLAAIAGAVAIEATGNGNSASAALLRDGLIIGGVYAVKTGFDKSSETTIHRDAIEELGESFSAEARPLVVDVEGETHELTGSAETQYTKWRSLLKRIYASETGLTGTTN